MAYVDIYAAATDSTGTLIKQVSVAMHKAAVDVTNEDPGAANHANRLRWAETTLASNSGPVNAAQRWIWKVLENATIQANPATATDSDCQFVVNSIVNDMANLGG